MKRLGVLLSGRGSNFVAIADSIAQGKLKGCEIAVVISNKADAAGLAEARERGLKAIAIEARGRKRAEHDQEIISTLREHGIDLVVLAGYMRVLSPEFVKAFPQKILNIHPSLLPAFPGLDAQEQAFNYGVQAAGCTVHFVDEELDHGVIVLQKTVAVQAGDDAQALAARILEQEHIAYSEAIARVLSGEYRVDGRRYVHN
jgi:phosphoribosylglycinamide formyltransferase-1